MRKILLTGKNGQVGWELQRTLAPLGEVIAIDLDELDLSQTSAIRPFVERVAPDLIVHPAAYTAVDKAESNADLAFAINEAAPRELARAAAKLGAGIIHYSTEYVFDGSKPEPWLETDVPNPQNVYGRSKLAGERAVADSGAAHLILRTSWVYGRRGANFLLTMMRLAAERPVLRVVDDQFGCPNWSRALAEATALIAARWNKDPAKSGLYHFSGQGRTSWHGFAAALLERAVAQGLLVDPQCPPDKVEAIPTREYPTPAVRPANSVMNTQKLRDTFDIVLPDWKAQLDLAMSD